MNGVDIVTYTNPGRPPNTTYYYRVRAFNGTVLGVVEHSLSHDTAPGPTGGSLEPGGKAVSPSQINLSWTDNATNETGFTHPARNECDLHPGGTPPR